MFDEIEAIIGTAKKNKNYMQRGAVSSEEISALESQLKIVLPKDYKYFIKHYGFCFWFGGVVSGLVGENKRYEKLCCAIRKTKYYHDLYDHDSSYLSVPQQGLVIGKWAEGGYYFLFSQESERAGEVGLFLTETYGEEVSKFKSFTDYLSFLVTATPDPELVDVDYDRIMDIIED